MARLGGLPYKASRCAAVGRPPQAPDRAAKGCCGLARRVKRVGAAFCNAPPTKGAQTHWPQPSVKRRNQCIQTRTPSQEVALPLAALPERRPGLQGVRFPKKLIWPRAKGFLSAVYAKLVVGRAGARAVRPSFGKPAQGCALNLFSMVSDPRDYG
jgi:hypothetical protein